MMSFCNHPNRNRDRCATETVRTAGAPQDEFVPSTYLAPEADASSRQSITGAHSFPNQFQTACAPLRAHINACELTACRIRVRTTIMHVDTSVEPNCYRRAAPPVISPAEAILDVMHYQVRDLNVSWRNPPGLADVLKRVDGDSQLPLGQALPARQRTRD
jgi:hypothetical protein